MFKRSFLLQLLLLCYSRYLVNSIIVKTTTGLIRGKLENYRGIKYKSFEGIPFAEPPVGNLRFMPPVPIRPWTDVLDATAPGYVCPQAEHFHLRHEMDENCLFLNIFVPVAKSTQLFPVVFLIHGGTFSLGSGKIRPIYGPELILKEDFVVVTTNYRLGALGFLSLGTTDVSGNAGLKDIILALKWVNKNIVKFGGDPNKILLLGQGSGAALVHYLLLTNQTTGLFHRAWLLAGSALSYRSLQFHPKENALKLAQTLGIKDTNKHRLAKKLKKIPPFSIIAAQEHIIKNEPRRGFVLRDLFSPVIEKPSSIALFTKSPLEIIRSVGLVQNVEIITGNNNNEGLEMWSVIKDEPQLIENLNENFELCIPNNIQYPYGSEERRNLANAIRDFYFNGGNITIFNTQNYIDLISDTAYTYSIDYWIYLLYQRKKILNDNYGSAVYYYNFRIDDLLNWAKLILGITYPGACHADELGYVFLTNVTETTLQNLNTQTQMIVDSVFYNMKNLTLNGDPTPSTRGVKWFEAGTNRAHIVFEDGQTMVNHSPIPKRLQFWYKEHAKYYKYASDNKLQRKKYI